MIIVTLATVPSVRKGIALSITPHLIKRLFISPWSASNCDINISETNCGTAMVITKIVRQSFLHLTPFLFIIIATIIPSI